MSLVALYTGSFDPLTLGHMDVIGNAAVLCDEVIVAIGVNPSKTPLFTAQERITLIESACGPLFASHACKLSVRLFSGLAVEAAREAGAQLLVRGLRDGSDLDFEMQMASMNRVMAPDIQTIFFPAAPAVRHITATLVRQVATMGGDASPFVPPVVAAALAQKTSLPS
ncbi:pantetheine-phosphate adenylyltransferase [Beijerinckia indica]|uniref:Phosphopantetheine adenylyltransferase n=1 Tax=Beijerinckia indica subsp. indica (strain ATCC 9039 / DSM 1715 / NCIMB 8712) TaxID=395963 RepID=COAD_BEII9|nr:pantetheine-phosphate adenylyltransferase [Beijerinckia indica]B2IHR4.1 RecName: Full=Phosphopantetheine adenylyltransferase; AltName: Full=Dephospho-CoA pyrophosphorylase; AltName: Full=Pantetheine-phosphate adenylyltransferase; Short=PPAT [Beijerinckia indica subsp. indica ATCC 9039]ACB95957.1 pantetheine-phosphate adenylyltransferase [Beijerinckia indica subsp. indica ATCC 9039]